MRDIGEGGVFRLGSKAECVRIFLDRHFRWMKHRGVPIAHIWSREYSRHNGEHLHLGYHLTDDLDASYIEQAAKWFEQDLGAPVKDAATIAQSVEGGWNIQRCIHGNNSGHRIAAYLTKAEPSEIITKWGKEKPNKRKPIRYKRGGEGPIEGNGKHAYRWGTSLLIGRTQRDRNGYMH